jgi:hypothetical protein
MRNACASIGKTDREICVAKRVFILGAGASLHAKAPLMKNFLDRARDLYPSLPKGRLKDAATLVFKAISSLQQVHSKSELDLFNLESLFTTFEMAATIRYLPPLDEAEIANLVEALQTVIVSTLDYSMRFEASPSEGILASRAYKDLATVIQRFQQGDESVAIITFNYDLGMELALRHLGIKFSYYLDLRQKLGDPWLSLAGTIPFLKLHGSINWGTTSSGPDAELMECPISWLADADYAIECLGRSGGPVPEGYSLDVGTRLVDFLKKKTGKTDIRDTPVIVPPGMYKAEYQNSLAFVWMAAAHELATAEYIYVLGYSLPLTDFFFHNLYALGTVSPTILRHFRVIDVDKEIESRFKKLLGPAARDRFRPPCLLGFENAMVEYSHKNLDFWEE